MDHIRIGENKLAVYFCPRTNGRVIKLRSDGGGAGYVQNIDTREEYRTANFDKLCKVGELTFCVTP